MKKLLALFLFLCASLAQAAAPVLPSASSIPDRTFGPAPLCVNFNGTGVTDADVSGTEFHDLWTYWAFGDSGAGNYTTGVDTGQSKNGAVGAVASHCYESVGTHKWYMFVSDGTTVKYVSGTITVTSQDAAYPGALTYCFYNATVGSDCPGGATQVLTANFTTALSTYAGSDRRFLFKRGDAFTCTTAGQVSDSTVTIGAYGSGAKPRLDAASATTGCLETLYKQAGTAQAGGASTITLSSGASGTDNLYNGMTVYITNGTGPHQQRVIASYVGATKVATVSVAWTTQPDSTSTYTVATITDIRVMDLEIVGTGAGSTSICIRGAVTVPYIAFLRVTCRETGRGFSINSGSKYTHAVIQDTTISNLHASSGGNCWFGWMEDGAFLGNNLDADEGAEHCLRLQSGVRVAVFYNNISGGNTSKHSFTLRALEHASAADDSQLVYVNGNVIECTLCDWVVKIAPAGETQSNWIYNVVVEGNWVKGGAAAQVGLLIEAVSVTVRNNVFDFTGSTLSLSAVGPSYTNTATPTVPMTDQVEVINNTVYNPTAGTTTKIVHVTNVLATNTLLQNNLGRLTGAGAVADVLLCTGGGEACATLVANSSDAEMDDTGTDPLFDNPTTFKGFRIGTGSDAATGGIAKFPSSKYDAFNCRNVKNANKHRGAFVPRLWAGCQRAAR